MSYVRFGIEVAQRIIRQRGEMNDGIEARHVLKLKVAHVLAQTRHGHDGAALCEGAPLIQIAIAAGNLVACCDQFGTITVPM